MYDHNAYQRAYQKWWRAANPNYFKEWQAKNRAYVTLKKQLYRAKKRREEEDARFHK